MPWILSLKLALMCKEFSMMPFLMNKKVCAQRGLIGVYELLLIQKKSMKLNDYKKKVERFDNITDGKSVEEVEEMVFISDNYFQIFNCIC